MAPAQTHDLQTYLADYERQFPEEELHVERPINADWEITALISNLEKAQKFPIVVCHKVVVDGRPMDMPLVAFLTGSRQRLARALGATVQAAGVALHERVQQR